jgi:subtilisin family serine protease
MKNKPIYLLWVLFMALFITSCGSDKGSPLTADATKQAVSSSAASPGVTVQSVLANMEKGKYAGGELLVKFRSGVVTTQSLKTHQALGASVARRFSSVQNLERIKLPAGLSVKDAIVRYMSDPSVEYAEPNYIRRMSVLPNDTFFGQQWALHNAGQFASGTAGADIKAPEAWDILPLNVLAGDNGIVIAVLDTGIDFNHSDLVNNIWINPGEIPNNLVDDDANGKVDDWRGWDFTTCASFSPESLTITTPLTGAQEVPSVATSGTGSAVLTFNLRTGMLSGTVTFDNLGSVATAADINQSFAGTNGSVIVALAGGAGGTSGTWTVPLGATLTAGQLNALRSNGLYVNIHSASNPGGELRGQIIFPGEANCVVPKPEDNDPSDDNGHGTHVSGIIGAVGNNGIGTSGVMWSVKIMALKMLNADGDGSTADEIAAIDYAVMMKNKGMNVKAINASFGGSSFSTAERDAVAAANAAGILFIAAAGNEQTDNDLVPEFPAGYSNPKFGGLANVISVAATDQNDKRASFSGYGLNSVQVGAPGVYILSTVPTSLFPSGYDFFSGTSMAAPHVTGLAGLLYSFYDGVHNTQFNSQQVRATILRYADTLPTLVGWIQTGGRINAFSALSSLLSPTNLTATAVSPSQIDLAWTDNARGEDGYRVQRKGPSDADFVDITIGSPLPPNATTFSNTGLSASTQYSYRVVAFNNISASFSSNTASATTQATAPPQTSSSDNGGGGGCTIGARQNTPTAVADLAVLLMPLLLIAMLRRRR